MKYKASAIDQKKEIFVFNLQNTTFLFFITPLVKRLEQRSLYKMIENILPFVMNKKNAAEGYLVAEISSKQFH